MTLVYGDPKGRTLLYVAADRDDGTTAGFVNLEVVGEDGASCLRLVRYSTLSPQPASVHGLREEATIGSAGDALRPLSLERE